MEACYFCWYARNEKYVKAIAKMSATAGAYTKLIGKDMSPRMLRMMRIIPATTAPRAVQRAFNITAGVKISISK
jgi:hypothetical protein